MSYKHLIFVIVLIYFNLSLTSSMLNYVECPDRVSACEDGKQCCSKGSGYSCCPSSSCCCQEGTYCCSCLSLTVEPNFLMNSLMESTTPFKTFTLRNKLQLNNTTFTDDSKEVEIIHDLLLTFDSFLNATSFYNHSPSSECFKDDVKLFIGNLKKTISTIKNQTLIENPIEFVVKLSALLSEELFFTKSILADTKNMPGEWENLLNQTYNHITDPDTHYFKKLIKNFTSNFFKIIELYNETKKNCAEKNFNACGSSMGLLFSRIFEL